VAGAIVLVALVVAGTADTARAAIAEGCPAVATFPAIECRAAALGQAMQIAAELGVLDRRSPFIVSTAEIAILDASDVCNSTAKRTRPRATARLARAAESFDHLRRRLTAASNRGHLDAANRDAYLAVIGPLVDDLHALRAGLVCPTSTENVCGDGVPQLGFSGGPGEEECDDGNTRDGDGCSAQCLIEPSPHDLPGFTAFAFSRQSAFGFCPPTGRLFDLEATTDTAGAVTLQWSILRDDAGCADIPFQCIDLDRASRVLTSAEAAELRAAFQPVRVVATLPNGCSSIAFDPCLVNAFAWDDFRANDFLCHAPLLRAEEVARILGVLDTLTH
jgi:cysteine-rich repeat protein